MAKKILYPTDEISASEIARGAARPPSRQHAAAVVRFLGECHWEPDMPARQRTAHNEGLIATALARQAGLPTLLINRPVPRLASHHYFGVDKDTQAIYFY